jgi:hypothetical protein
MKNIKLFLILLLFLTVTSFKAQTVYVTESGKKYHAKNCDVAKTGKKGLELSEAKKQGYEPCKVCKVTQELKEADKPKNKKTTDKPKK